MLISEEINKEKGLLLNEPNLKGSNTSLFEAFLLYRISAILNERQSVIENTRELSFKILSQIIEYIYNNITNNVFAYEYELMNSKGLFNNKTEDSKKREFSDEIIRTSKGLLYILDKYPKLDVILYNVVNGVLSFLGSILDDYSYDRVKVDWPFKTESIVGIDLFLGDLHKGGKSVSLIRFSNNFSLYYKPRGSYNERDLDLLLNSLKAQGLKLSIMIPKFYDSKGHSWVEIVAIKEMPEGIEPVDYYYNLGSLLCVLYWIGASDIISDNIISSSALLYLIDIESIIPYSLGDSLGDSFARIANNSVLTVGILPSWRFTSQNNRESLSSVLFSSGKNRHLPIRNKQVIELDSTTKNPFIDGFIYCYGFLLARGESIVNPFLKNRQRIILHDTYVYGLILRELTSPESLHCDRDVVDIVSALLENTKVSIENKQLLNNSIIRQLYNYNIPLFYISEKGELVDDENTIIDRDFILHNCPKLKKYSIYDRDVQCEFINKTIEFAFEYNTRNCNSYYVSSNDNVLPSKFFNNSFRDCCITAALEVADNLIKRAIETADGVNWISKRGNNLDDKYEIGFLNNGLYDGITGIGVFFHQLYRILNDDKFLSISKKISNSLIERTKDYNRKNRYEKEYNRGIRLLSFHSFPLCALFFQDMVDGEIDQQLLEDTISGISRTILSSTTSFGYLDGVAGYLDYLLEGNKNGLIDSSYVEQAIDCLFINCIIDGDSISWEHQGDGNSLRRLGGFAHGSAGIAYVLYKAYKYTGSSKAFTLFKGALSHDRSFFNIRCKSWNDGRSIQPMPDMGMWCHGAAGIALSRLLLSDLGYSDDLISNELDCAIEIIKSRIGLNQCLCHGDMGNLEVLSAIGNYNNDSSLKEYALKKVKDISERLTVGGKLICGDYGLMPIDGLYLGITGMAYQLLRFADWHSIPSMLVLDNSNSIINVLHK